MENSRPATPPTRQICAWFRFALQDETNCEKQRWPTQLVRSPHPHVLLSPQTDSAVYRCPSMKWSLKDKTTYLGLVNESAMFTGGPGGADGPPNRRSSTSSHWCLRAGSVSD